MYSDGGSNRTDVRLSRQTGSVLIRNLARQEGGAAWNSMVFNPGGVSAISRGLRSGATTPPVRGHETRRPRQGAQPNRGEATTGAGIPAGMQNFGSGPPSGGVATLNHRLIAVKPPASKPPEERWFSDNRSCRQIPNEDTTGTRELDLLANGGSRSNPQESRGYGD